MLELILLSLAVWRITALFVYDDGPRGIFVRLRDAIGGPLTCFWCTSAWVSLVASLFFPAITLSWREWFIWWWAVAGSAVLIDEVRGGECVDE